MNATSIASNVVSLFNRTQLKAPRPIIRTATPEDLAWEPALRDQATEVNGQWIRSGDSIAIIRPGYERWPLGHVMKGYVPTGRASLLNMCTEAWAGLVTHTKSAIFGIGVYDAHEFTIEHQKAKSVQGAPVTSKLLLTNGNDGKTATRASMVIYVGSDAIGSVYRARAIHVGAQQVIWTGDVLGMIEKSVLVQDALIELLTEASNHEFTDVERAWFKARNMTIRDKNARTLLDAVRSWTKGGNTTRGKNKLTWGVWRRRLDDKAIRALVLFLGHEKHGKALDDAFGYKKPNYGPKR